MDEHPNAALLRRLYGGETSVIYENMAADYAIHIPGRSRIAGDFRGAEGHRTHRERIIALAQGSFHHQPLAYLADDEWGCVPQRIRAERGAQRLDIYGVGLWRFRNGLFAEHWGLASDQDAFDDFFS